MNEFDIEGVKIRFKNMTIKNKKQKKTCEINFKKTKKKHVKLTFKNVKFAISHVSKREKIHTFPQRTKNMRNKIHRF